MTRRHAGWILHSLCVCVRACECERLGVCADVCVEVLLVPGPTRFPHRWVFDSLYALASKTHRIWHREATFHWFDQPGSLRSEPVATECGGKAILFATFCHIHPSQDTHQPLSHSHLTVFSQPEHALLLLLDWEKKNQALFILLFILLFICYNLLTTYYNLCLLLFLLISFCYLVIALECMYALKASFHWFLLFYLNKMSTVGPFIFPIILCLYRFTQDSRPPLNSYYVKSLL